MALNFLGSSPLGDRRMAAVYLSFPRNDFKFETAAAARRGNALGRPSDRGPLIQITT
jgi:hypothetical protein